MGLCCWGRLQGFTDPIAGFKGIYFYAERRGKKRGREV